MKAMTTKEINNLKDDMVIARNTFIMRLDIFRFIYKRKMKKFMWRQWVNRIWNVQNAYVNHLSTLNFTTCAIL